MSFRHKFERLGDVADLNEAISAQQQALHLTPDDDPHQPMHLHNLGHSFQSRFERLGDLVNLDEAITAQRQAVRLTPDDHPDRPEFLDSLGGSLFSRFERLGNLVDLDEAITAQQKAVRLTDDHPNQARCLNNLGISLETRFERLNDLVDIHEAISAQREAVRLTPDGHPGKPARLSNLGNSFVRRFDRLGDLISLDDAIMAQKQAVRLTSDDHPNKPGWLNNLGNSIHTRFARFGGLVDLEEAIAAQQQAIHLTPGGHPDEPMYLNNVGMFLRSRFERLGNTADLDGAIKAHRQAVCLTPDDHPGKSQSLHNLGSSLRAQLQHQPDDATLKQAISTYSQSAKLPSGLPYLRFAAAKIWASLCLPTDSVGTLDAYSTLVSLLPRVVWLGRTIEQRYSDIPSIGNAMAGAVSAAIHFGEFDLALEWMEQGRSIVWGQMLQLRTPLDKLRECHSKEANELERISRGLDSAGVACLDRSTRSGGGASQSSLEQLAQAHRRLAEEYDTTLDRIHNLPGFEDFLQPAKSATLCNAATSGPVVILNAHETSCDALILLPRTSKISHVPLPGIQLSAIEEMQVEFVGVIRGAGITQRPSGAYDGVGTNLSDILRRLWAYVVEPILHHLEVGCSLFITLVFAC